eukprot:9262093-Pyramimonas_sp.AAC.1
MSVSTSDSSKAMYCGYDTMFSNTHATCDQSNKTRLVTHPSPPLRKRLRRVLPHDQRRAGSPPNPPTGPGIAADPGSALG